jgi:hypothetical protein
MGGSNVGRASMWWLIIIVLVIWGLTMNMLVQIGVPEGLAFFLAPVLLLGGIGLIIALWMWLIGVSEASRTKPRRTGQQPQDHLHPARVSLMSTPTSKGTQPAAHAAWWRDVPAPQAKVQPRKAKRKKGFWEQTGYEIIDDMFTLSRPKPPPPRVHPPSYAAKERYRKFQAAGTANETAVRLKQLHQEAVPHAKRPTAAGPRLCDREELRREYERQAVAGVPVWKREERRMLAAGAAISAEQAASAADERARIEMDAVQAELDLRWEELENHKCESVLEALEDSFRHAPYNTLAVGRLPDGALVLVALDESRVPDVEPDLTETGMLTVRRLSKTRWNHHYSEAVAATTVNAARRALAATPASEHATAVTYRRLGDEWQPIAWLCLTRSQDEGWANASGSVLALLSTGGHLSLTGRARAVGEASFSLRPELGKLLEPMRLGLDAMRTTYPESASESTLALRVLSDCSSP